MALRLLSAIHLILIIAGAFLLVEIVRKDTHWSEDFTALYTGWTLARSPERHNLYDLKTQQRFESEAVKGHDLSEVDDGLLPYLNPPHLTWIFIPLSFLNRQTAFFVWLLINLGCLVIIIYSLAPDRLVASAFLALPIVLIALGVGALSLLVTLAIVRAYIAVKDERDNEAAFWLLLATIKPQMVLFPLVAFLLIRGLKLLVSFAAMAAVTIGITLAILGASVFTEYLHLLQTISRLPGRMSLLVATTSTFRGMLYSVFGYESSIVNPISVVVMLAALAFTVYLWRSKAETELKLALTTLLGLFFGLHVNPVDDVLIILPVVILLARYPKLVALWAIVPLVFYVEWRMLYFRPFSPTLHLIMLGLIGLASYALKPWRLYERQTVN